MNTELLPIIQKINPSFYLNPINKRGLGVVYIQYRVGGLLYRISTGIRVKSEYWSKEEKRIRVELVGADCYGGVSRLDWVVYNHYSGVLNSLVYEVEKRKEYYICDTEHPYSCKAVGDDIAKTLNPSFRMSNKDKIKARKPLISLMRGIVMEMDNVKSQATLLGIVATFERFLNESGIEDCVESMNMETMRAWRDWLANGNLSVTRAKACIGYSFTLGAKLERKYGFDFGLDRGKIEPIKDKRSTEEKRSNGIALTEGEIEQIANADLKGDKRLETARDMFLLQCWCGCRVEDLPLLLTSGNISTDSEGEIHCTFTTQKKGVTAIVPLNTLYPSAWKLVEKYVDKCPYNTVNEHRAYNRDLRVIAREARLDREITYIGQKGGKKYTEINPLCDVISSHDGRHTFITNAIRYKGLTPDKVKLISGHADTKLIEAVYANLTTEDNKNILKEAIREAKGVKSIGTAPHRESNGAKETENQAPTDNGAAA